MTLVMHRVHYEEVDRLHPLLVPPWWVLLKKMGWCWERERESGETEKSGSYTVCFGVTFLYLKFKLIDYENENAICVSTSHFCFDTLFLYGR